MFIKKWLGRSPKLGSTTKGKLAPLLTMLLFGVVGSALLFRSFASTPFVSTEPEQAALSGALTKGSDSSASGSGFVSFGLPAVSPTVTGKDYYGIAAGGGLAFLSDAELTSQLDGYRSVGAQWVRFDMLWALVQTFNQQTYDWSHYDKIMTQLNARGLKGLAILDQTPGWAKSSGCLDDWCPPANPADFAAFAGAAANRYASQGLRHYEVWNEPNIEVFWKPAPNAADYTTLLKATYAAIKAVDPGAVVISGGLSPAVQDATHIAPTNFLTEMYANGAKNYFDALGYHPYCYFESFDCPNTYVDWSAWSKIKDTPVNIRGIMTSNADSAKKIWATEFGAPTNGAGSVTEAHQAQMVTDAYATWKSYSFAGPLFWYSYKDICSDTSSVECWFGLVRLDGSERPAGGSYRASSAATQ